MQSFADCVKKLKNLLRKEVCAVTLRILRLVSAFVTENARQRSLVSILYCKVASLQRVLHVTTPSHHSKTLRLNTTNQINTVMKMQRRQRYLQMPVHPFLMASCILFSCSCHSYLLCSCDTTGFSDPWLFMPEVLCFQIYFKM